MVFDHKVKYGDVLYLAGEDVPIDEPKAEDKVEIETKFSAEPLVEKPKRRGRPSVRK